MARRKTAQERRIDELLAQFEPEVRKAFIQALRAQAMSIDIDSLEAALRAGQIERAIDLLRINKQVLFPVTEAIRAGYIAAGLSVAKALPITIRAQFGFGGNDRAVATIDRVTTKLAEILDAEQTGMAREIFRKGISEGIPPRKQALDMVGRIAKGTKTRTGGFIGLDSQRAAQAKNVKAMLSDPERVHEYFKGKSPRYTTTDRRFDRTVRKAIAEGKVVPKNVVDKIASAHKSRLLKNRAETISRTETLNSLRAGQHDGFASLIDSGAVSADRLTKKWLAASDGRTRDAHVALNGDVVAFNGLFNSQTGAQLAYPGDSTHGAGPDDLIQCFPPWVKIARSGITAAIRRKYIGEIVEFTVAGGVKLAVTPNHPILTRRGWVAAGEVDEGDQLFNAGFSNFGPALSGPEVEDMHITAEQLYNSAECLAAPMRADRSIVNLHGDIPDQDVDIVAVPSRLGDALESAISERVNNFLFSSADVAQGRLLALRMELAGMGVFTGKSDRFMGTFSAGLAKLWGESLSGPQVPFGNIGAFNSKVSKAFVNGSPADAHALGYSKNGKPLIKKLFNIWKELFSLSIRALGSFLAVNFTPCAVHRGNAQITQAGANNRLAQPSLTADIQNATGAVIRDFNGGKMGQAPSSPVVRSVAISHIRRLSYDGFVYNFESKSSVLVANGIVNHNCRCATIYRIKPKKVT